MESELFFKWLSDIRLRNELDLCVRLSKKRRKESLTQHDVADILNISLTKIKQIENGTCVEFNSINNYKNFFKFSILDQND